MEPLDLYRKFSQEFFYSFHKHSSDLELEELGARYHHCLDKNDTALNEILQGNKHPSELRPDACKELEFLAQAEAKFSNDVPVEVKGKLFRSETGFHKIQGELRRLVGGQAHLMRLIKPSEYDKQYWFYTGGHKLPQNIICREFGMDLVDYLKAVSIARRAKLRNLSQAIAYRKNKVYQFWTLAPYLHLYLQGIGCDWSVSMRIILKIASKQYFQEGRSFAGQAKYQLGYDERMPSHLLARIEAMRDIHCLQQGQYTEKYGIEWP